MSILKCYTEKSVENTSTQAYLLYWFNMLSCK